MIFVAAACFLPLFFLIGCQNAQDGNARLDGSSSSAEPTIPLPSDIAKVKFVQIPDGMTLVPAGLAIYGCDPDIDASCGPYDIAMTVAYNEAFLIDKTETGIGGLRACVAGGGCAANDCIPETGDQDAYPAACVSYADAEAYCTWAGKRMPTDWEWERAARGMSGAIYPWGSDWCPSCLNWTDGGAFDGSIDQYAGAAPVDSFPTGQTSYGGLNMSGNIWELTRGEYEDQSGTHSSIFARGGGYTYPEGAQDQFDVMEFYRTTFRVTIQPDDFRAEFVGFRCAADPEYE